MKDQLEKAVQFVKDNPIKVAAITLGVAVTGFVVFKALQYGGELTEDIATVAEVLEEVV